MNRITFDTLSGCIVWINDVQHRVDAIEQGVYAVMNALYSSSVMIFIPFSLAILIFAWRLLLLFEMHLLSHTVPNPQLKPNERV